MSKLLAILALALGAAGANAAEFGLHLGSVHIPGNGYNNVNPGAYIISDDGWTLGGYYNSERHVSVYAGRTFELKLRDGLAAQLAVGAIAGYEARDVLPLVAPSLSWQLPDSDWRARVIYLPKVEKNGSHVLHLTVQRGF